MNELGTDDKNRHPQATFYEKALFLNRAIQNWRFHLTQLSKYEQEDYKLAVKKLEKWASVNEFVTEIGNFVKEVKQLTAIRRAEHSAGHLTMHGFPELEEEVMEKYEQLVQQLEAFPEWKEKDVKEVESLIQILSYCSRVEEIEQSPFNAIDPQKYFK